MRDSLERAKMEEDPPENEERLSAEIQRKGCLLLGGFDNADASTKIIEIGGLSVLIDAMQWYRFHAGVCKWALWAAFNLCYDRPKHQCEPLEVLLNIMLVHFLMTIETHSFLARNAQQRSLYKYEVFKVYANALKTMQPVLMWRVTVLPYCLIL
jgi:hypothetical protein